MTVMRPIIILLLMYDADIWTLQKSRSKMPLNMVLDRDEEDQFD